MENVNELLEKYFRGETTLVEEKFLKQYFKTDQVLPKYEMYRPLFEVFSQESLEEPNVSFQRMMPKQRKIKRIGIQTFAYSGIAATLLLALWFSRPQINDNYAIIRGKKIDNKEYAQRYAEAKINKVNELLAKSMRPMESINKVRAGLEPLHKISNVKNEMNEKQ